jgi:rhamnosyltransferase
MHDPTEGGIAGAVEEMALASNTGITIDTDRVNVLPETRRICEALDLDPWGLISSGALFSARALREIGTMDEGLFIDHVDTEWFLRAHHRGWRSYGVCDAVMRHSLGERTFRVWLGRWRYLPIHKPFRYYYIYRNSVLLYRRSYPTIRWKQTDILRLLMMFVMFAVFAGDRVENLKMMCRGIVDGFRDREGRLDSSR